MPTSKKRCLPRWKSLLLLGLILINTVFTGIGSVFLIKLHRKSKLGGRSLHFGERFKLALMGVDALGHIAGSYVRCQRELLQAKLASIDFNSLTPLEHQEAKRICWLAIEEGLNRSDVAAGYDGLAQLYSTNECPYAHYQAIKNGSYGLHAFYTPAAAQRLGRLIIKGYETEVLQTLGGALIKSECALNHWLTGYAKDELTFLTQLTELGIPELAAKAWYRLSFIHRLGGASNLDQPLIFDVKAALKAQQAAFAHLPKVLHPTTVDVALIFDEKYAPHAATTIASALFNSDPQTTYHFHIVTDPDQPLSETTQQRLASMTYIRDYEIDFTPFPIEVLPEGYYKLKKALEYSWPALSQYRLFLEKVFPDLDGIIYLDSDTLVRRDLSPLWQKITPEYSIAGVLDVQYVDTLSDAEFWNPLSYINSGMVVFNLQKMRQDNTYAKTQKAYENPAWKLRYPDQNILNFTFRGDTKHLAERWNVLLMLVKNASKQGSLYASSDKLTPSFNEFIRHYADEVRPWSPTAQRAAQSNKVVGEWFQEYWAYQALTLWKADT